MSIYEYDEEKHMRQEREEWEEIGREVGLKAGSERMAQLTDRLLEAGRLEDLKRAAKEEVFRERLYEEFGI